jgi:ribulose-5-phosphate 4-epimerase/fuculose-1-phosphate aldolase
MTSSPHGPYTWGYTRATMANTKGSNTVTWSKSHKVRLSTDRGLQFALLKLESLVIVDQQCHGEYVPEPCTHRPSSHGSW